jgi:hypothetical protein
MMTEKRRGMATRANASGSLVSSFKSPIYVPPLVDVSIPGPPSIFQPLERIRNRLENYIIKSYNVG